MSIDTVIFFCSAVVAVFGAVMMISQRNPVASVLYFILSLLAQAVLYVQLSALFLAAILVIVYSGAIMVLFLFVIMLLNLRGKEDLGKGSTPLSTATKYILSILFVVELAFVIRSAVFKNPGTVGIVEMKDEAFGSVETVSELLFTKYLYPFELTSVLLLAAIVGAVVIARRAHHHESKLDSKEGEA